MAGNCEQALSKSGVSISGFTKGEVSAALCNALRYNKAYSGALTPQLIKDVTATRWAPMQKSVLGGLQHVLSVDNAASYAELWYRGGSWYAVTGADFRQLAKSGEKGEGIWEITGVTKGMGLEEVTTRFLEATFGPSSLGKSKDCGCGK